MRCSVPIWNCRHWGNHFPFWRWNCKVKDNKVKVFLYMSPISLKIFWSSFRMQSNSSFFETAWLVLHYTLFKTHTFLDSSHTGTICAPYKYWIVIEQALNFQSPYTLTNWLTTVLSSNSVILIWIAMHSSREMSLDSCLIEKYIPATNLLDFMSNIYC